MVVAKQLGPRTFNNLSALDSGGFGGALPPAPPSTSDSAQRRTTPARRRAALRVLLLAAVATTALRPIAGAAQQGPSAAAAPAPTAMLPKPDPLQQLRDNAAMGSGLGPLEGLAGLARAVDGPLQGVLTFADQRAALEADAANARLLRTLADGMADAYYSRLGSESDFGVFPVLLQAAPPGAQGEAEEADGASGGGDGDDDDGEGAGASAWQTPAVSEVLAALRVPGALAARFDRHHQRTFDTAEAFLTYMSTQHLRAPEGAPESDPHSRALLHTVERLAAGAAPPFVQLLAGAEGLYNPIPVFWLGRARAGSKLLGLASGVVWT